MHRLVYIINTLQHAHETYKEKDWLDEAKEVEDAIQLLRAGAGMRQSSKTEISEATRAWDAALDASSLNQSKD